MGILASASTGAISGLGILVYAVVIIGIMYFMMIRPNKKEKEKLNAMLSSMAIGDSVCTTSGFYGIIIDIVDDTVIVEFGNNKNCRISMKSSAIAVVEKPGTEK